MNRLFLMKLAVVAGLSLTVVNDALASNPIRKISKFDGFVTNTISSRKVSLTPGVKAYQIDFETDRTAPLRMCVLQVKLSRGDISIEATYPDTSTEDNWPVSTMVDQARAVEADGNKVIAAINADFFDMGHTGYPIGPVYHDGVAVWDPEAGARAYFGIDKSGKPVFGDAEDYAALDKSEVEELVGGGPVLISGGSALKNGDPYRAPRTAVGCSPDGKTLYVVIVDELTPNRPRDGITLDDLGLCMHEIGAYDAVNLDGGGSSTFAINEGGEYRAWNKQPDARLRRVADGFVVVIGKRSL